MAGKLWAAAAPFGVAALLFGAGATSSAATVLTLEGGLVGIQPFFHFTPENLQGALCESPNTCTPLYYFALPVGPATQNGGEAVSDKIAAIHGEDPDQDVVLFGHSQGGQVIYSALRDWSTGKLPAPDPDTVSWVSSGNPENKYGGTMGGIGYTNGQGLPDDLDYDGTEVIRQYDGWADEPDDTGNLLAVVNAYIGRQTLHTHYEDVDLDDPRNVRKVEYYCDGSPTTCDATNAKSSVTYVWVPTDTLPLVAWTGPFAPALDNMLRPAVDKAYTGRPVIPDPTPPEPESNTVAARSAPKVAEITNAELSQSVPSVKSAGTKKDSADRSGGAHRVAGARPVSNVIATVKKVVDRITDRITDRISNGNPQRVSAPTGGDDGQGDDVS